MTYPELSFDVTDGWIEVMYKDGQTFCQLCIFVLLCNYLSRVKTNGSGISNIANCNAHLDFRGTCMQVFSVVLQKKML